MPARRRPVPAGRLLCWTALAVILGLVPARAAAGGFGGYLMPTIGYDWMTLKSLEVEQGFLSAPVDLETGDIDEEAAEELALGNARRSVGRKSYYEGGGLSTGVAAGLRFSSLRIGAEYTWSPVAMEGYSKRYRYDPEKLRARGRRFLDEGAITVQRALCVLGYGLPLGPLEITIRTRIGGVFLDEGPLIVGNSVDRGAGFVGDLGLGLELSVLGWLGIAVHGSFGFISFSGQYDGAFGTMGGIQGGLVLHL
ncbi:MAG TPA: hypothetical protein VM285_16030 [Polyangia bacterium]|nr:hypothetical protein [Polyangia bacterium]